MPPFNPKDLFLILPELCLVVSILALVGADLAINDGPKKRLVATGLALLGVLGAGLCVVLLQGMPATSGFAGQIAFDPIASLFKMLFVAVTGVSIFMSLLSKELPDRHIGEYFALLVSIAFGMFLMASANDLLMVYLSIEMVSIVSYAMAGYRAHDKRASEAALKYVVYGGAASGLMLFGISLFYGMFGTTELTALHRALTTWQANTLLESVGPQTFPMTVMLSFVLMFAGIGYKIAVVPFHMWSPDVYEGAPTPFTGFLSVGPKAAGFALLMRVFVGAFIPPGEAASAARGFSSDLQGMMTLGVDIPLPAVLGIVAAVTMTLGNLAAIPQNNVKRLLAYSSIAHAGYLLMGFVVLSEASLHAVTLYLTIYYLMNIGAFAVVQAVRDETGGETLHDFRGLGNRQPLLAVCMTVFLLSLTGLPPLAGFVGKFYLFAAVLERGGFWYVALAVVGVVNSAVSLYYYMRVAKAMWLTSPLEEREPAPMRAYALISGLLAVPTLILGLYWAPASATIRSSLAFYRSPAPAAASAQASDPTEPRP